LTLSLPKLRKNAKTILKTYELSIYYDMHYTKASFCKIGQKMATD